ncbi:hypothetical protein [Nocardia neocaledoniensis]|nr:hypothetical protein [Nocardia neocaledoniensis]
MTRKTLAVAAALAVTVLGPAAAANAFPGSAAAASQSPKTLDINQM